MASEVSVDEVLKAVAPCAGVDRAALVCLLNDEPPPEGLLRLLASPDPSTVRAGVLYLGLQGSMRQCAVLALCLRHQDAGVAELAEFCLWSLWMHAGSAHGNHRLAVSIGCIRDGDYAGAIDRLTRLAEDEPFFAEAYFQCGIALCLSERSAEAARAFRQAMRLNPHHFGAAAVLGHVSVEQGNLAGALHYYRRALEIHPRLEHIPEALRRVEAITGPRCKAE